MLPYKTSDRLTVSEKLAALQDLGSSSQREAAMLFSVSEKQLDDNNDVDQALSSAKQALALFKKEGDRTGAAYTLRLIIRANVEKADLLMWADENSKEARDVIKRTEKMAKEELEVARENGDKRSQGAILLSLAQMNFDGRGADKRNEALQAALTAAPLLKQVGEPQLEAVAHLALARIYYKKRDVQASITSATAARAIYQSIGNKTGEGEALHSIGAANVQAHRVAEALESSGKAAALYKEAGNLKMYARECHAMADWNLQRSDPVNGLSAAKESYNTFKELQYGKGWEASSLSMMVECLVGMQKVVTALQAAKRAVKDQKARGNVKEQVRCMEALIHAMAADNDHDAAEDVAEEAIRLSQSLGDRHLEIETRKLASELSMSAQKFPSALRQAEAVKELYKDLGATKEEAFELMHLVTKVNYMSDDKRKMKESVEEAMKLVEQLGDKNVEGHALLARAAACSVNGEVDEAIKAAQEAGDVFHEDGDKSGEARSMLQVSVFQHSQGDLKGAMAAAAQSLELRQELGDRRGQALALLQMAEFHMQNEKYKEARELLQDGVSLARANHDDRIACKLLTRIGEAYCGSLEHQDLSSRVAKELLDKALRVGREAAKAAAQSQDMKLEAQAQFCLSSIYLLAGKHGDMIQAANDAISLYKQSENPSGQINAMCLIAKAFMQQGSDNKANSVVEAARDLAKKVGDSVAEQKASELLKEIASRRVVASSMVIAGPVAVTATADPAAGPAPAAGAPAAPAGGAVKGYTPPNVDVVKSRIVQMVCDMSGEDAFDEEQPFMDAGIDSLASVELRTSLQKAFGVPLPSTVMFNYPTTVSIADFLVSEMVDNQVSLS